MNRLRQENLSAASAERSAETRPAFTLVELLTVMVLLALMAGMTVTAVRGTQRLAKSAKTRSVIATCNNVIEELYEQYQYRALAVEIPNSFVPANRGAGEVGFEVLAVEAARVRLMMLRDLMRMELPDRLSDLSPLSGQINPSSGSSYPAPFADPVIMRAAANPVLVNGSGLVVGSRDDNSVRRMFETLWYGSGDEIPSRMAGYRDRIPVDLDVRSTAAIANEGAECLYLIMSTAISGGSSAIDRIPGNCIGDTDEDGLPEILDGWGNPLAFIRWPVGYFGPTQSVDTALPDDFDLFRTDFAYAEPGAEGLALDVSDGVRKAPWSIRPLILSAGSDGEFGIALNPWSDASTEEFLFSLQDATLRWPVGTDRYGNQAAGRGQGPGATTYSVHPFPDPYLREFVNDNTGAGSFTGLLPGEVFPGDDAAEVVVDNLSNYELAEDVGI